MTDRQDDLTDWQKHAKKMLNKNIASPPRPLGEKSDARKAAVCAAVIERVAQVLYSEIETEHTFVSWGDASVFEAVRFKVIAKTALSALRPGDVLPNGCVVVAAKGEG